MFQRKKRSKSDVAVSGSQMVKLKNRSSSMPTALPRIKGILKHRTVDDSLHNPYGEGKVDTDSSSGSGPTGRRGIEFKDILIREYARTIGDNPSCSSGPPIG